MNIYRLTAAVLRAFLPAGQVILSRGRRILVPADGDASVHKSQSAGRGLLTGPSDTGYLPGKESFSVMYFRVNIRLPAKKIHPTLSGQSTDVIFPYYLHFAPSWLLIFSLGKR